MGFFSSECHECGKSIKAPYDLPTSKAWMNAVIVVASDGRLLTGSYDGYGRILDAVIPEDSTWRHAACAKKAGIKGVQYAGQSNNAHDQGYFDGEQGPDKDEVIAALTGGGE